MKSAVVNYYNFREHHEELIYSENLTVCILQLQHPERL